MTNILDTMRPVALDDQSLFEAYFTKYPPRCSEMTFTNIFCWALVKNHRFREYRKHLLVSYQRDSEVEPSFFPPVGETPHQIMLEPLPGLSAYKWVAVPEDLCPRLAPEAPLAFDRDNSDYYYRVEALCALKGSEFDGKRNFVRRFGRLNPSVRALQARDAKACLGLQEQWLFEQEARERSAAEETTAVKTALQHFDALPITGVVVEVDGRVVAFAIGERLNGETFVEHHEKADRGFTGAYQFLLHALAQAIADGSRFLNRGQDLGDPGLRKAKLSWQPAGLVGKYTLLMRS